jgi:chorismate mutase / prephenate dehydratase
MSRRFPQDTNMVTAKPGSPLDELRRQIDEIDNGLQDLLVRRAALVETVIGTKQTGGVAPFRPGREAQIVRRLVGRHRGRFPRASLIRIWRELLSAMVAMQTDLSLAVCDGCRDLARDHFGIRVPLLNVPTSDQVLLAVAEDRAVIGVVPLAVGEDMDPWWLQLLAPAMSHIRIIARLPFGSIGNALGECEDALVIAAMEPEPSGDDCTVFAIASPDGLDAAALTEALLDVRIDSNPLASAKRDRGAVHLIETDAQLEAADPRLSRALAKLHTGTLVTRLGLYARPIPDASLDGIAPV